MENKELKVFELRWVKQGEKEWMCAHTNIEALRTYFNITDTDITDLDYEDEVIEVPKEKWAEIIINNSEYDESDPDDWAQKTVEEYMKTATSPDIIAGTMYE